MRYPRFVLAVIVLALVGSVFTAPPASAGVVCDRIGFCGRIKSYSGSHQPLRICNGWTKSSGGRCAGTIRFLWPGEVSTKYFRDTDGFEVQANQHVHVGTLEYNPGDRVKIRDGQYFRVTVHRGARH